MKTVGARQVWAVQEITAALGRRLEGIPSLWVEAEIGNLRQRGGQVYFTLRDAHQIDASMRSVLFDRLPVRPEDGSLVLAYGRVEFWPDRAQISMRIERLEPAGEGTLLAQIEAVKVRLAADGLLADARKRRLPLLPRRIGLITSAVGAARNDVLNNLWARFPADVVLADAPVQGDGAPAGIIRALAALNAIPDVDVIIVARGGGPLEDLMAFNDEALCRAVAASRVPVVSAVGHEKDVTVCDLVADRRVSTPTAAAAVVAPDLGSLNAGLADASRGLVRGLVRVREHSAALVAQRTSAMLAGLRAYEARASARTQSASQRMGPALIRHAERSSMRVPEAGARLARAGAGRLTMEAGRLDARAALLDALSPQRTVARGYAIVRDPRDAHPVISVAGVRAGDAVELELRDGIIDATVEGVRA